MVHIIFSAAKNADTDCSGVIRALVKKLMAEEQNVLNVRFSTLSLPHSRIGESSLVQLDMAADLCATYLVKDFLFDPMHFLRERMFYRAHFKHEVKTYYVQEDSFLRSPVSIFASQICEVLHIPVPKLEMPTFKDNFFDSRVVRILMQEQSAQFATFWKSLSDEQKMSLPHIYRELDMDFLLDDWVGLVRYIENRHIKIISKQKEAAFIEPFSFIFNCIPLSTVHGGEESQTIPSELLKEWGYTEDVQKKIWYCTEESYEKDIETLCSTHPQEEVGKILLKGEEWVCF